MVDEQVGTLSPGSSSREAPKSQEIGKEKYKERIRRESKFADDHKNLPFKFGAPKKSRPSNVEVFCEHCGLDTMVTKITVAWICRGCGELAHAPKVEL